MSHHRPDRQIDSPLDRVQRRLDGIKFAVDSALTFKKVRSLRWQCSSCGYVMHFTKPMAVEAVSGTCDKCWGEVVSTVPVTYSRMSATLLHDTS